MASFKNKIDLKKTKRFLALFLPLTKKATTQIGKINTNQKFVLHSNFLNEVHRDIPDRATPRLSKEIELPTSFDICTHHETAGHEKIYHPSIKSSYQSLGIRKEALFSQNEIRSPRRSSLFSKTFKPFHTNHCGRTDQSLQIFFHCSPKLDKESCIETKNATSVSDYLRKKYKPFKFKSLTQRGQSIKCINTIENSSSESFVSQRLARHSTKPYLMRLLFSCEDCAVRQKQIIFRHASVTCPTPSFTHRRWCTSPSPKVSPFAPHSPFVMCTDSDDNKSYGTKSFTEVSTHTRQKDRAMSCKKILNSGNNLNQNAERVRADDTKKGNHFVICLKKNSFWLLQRFVKDEAISILGGIYGKTPISQTAILFLAKELQYDTVYYRSVSLLQKNPTLLVETLNHLYFRLYSTLCFLKDYKDQAKSSQPN